MTFIYILIGICIFLTVIALFLLILPVSGLYMFLFEHEEWKYWKLFSRNVNNFKYIRQYSGGVKSYVFTWKDYKAFVWEGEHHRWASVHFNKANGECICSKFWKSKSLQFAEKLMKNKEQFEI